MNRGVRRLWLRSVPVLALPVLFLFAITQQSDIPIRYFFADLPVVLQVPILASVITSTTVIVWCSGGLLALFASTLCSVEDRPPLRFIGWFSILLGVDDLVMLHETLLPRALGATEKMAGVYVEIGIFSLYGGLLCLWLIRYHKTVEPAVASFLWAAAACFAFSIAADLASSFKLFGPWSRFRSDYDFQVMVEDSPKFIGVVLWGIFLWHYSRLLINRSGAS